MLNLQIRTHLLLCLTACFLAAPSIYACEFHGGYSGGALSRFGQYSAPHLSGSYSRNQDKNESRLSITAPKMTKAARGKKTELAIGFDYASDNPDSSVQLLLDLGPAITVADNKRVVLNGTSGQHVFDIVPNASGTYRLVVTAKVMDVETPDVRHEVIYLSVVE